VWSREESGYYDSSEPGYHVSIGKNYFAIEWSREESRYYDSLEPGYHVSIGKQLRFHGVLKRGIRTL